MIRWTLLESSMIVNLRKTKKHTNSTELFQSTRPTDPTMQTNELLLRKQKMNLHEQSSTTYHIKDVMGCDLPPPPINNEELKTNWHLFELKIAAEELKDQNRPSQPNL